ncbi:PRC-barrel domain-containing protein [Devosia algicola]|uniref:PRC-barrel domain-containing protein n=1 Tax=Devosia algicola TaxID=3026418 RepID=A0ABY7YSM8_9HYPH|nr:PRC-barrel domain-containing protein [Devosia algicola]WDR04197.1 PRC-barrel domain-containing protein [Devosia algicola]
MAPVTPADNTAVTNNAGNLPTGYTAVTVEDLTAENLQGAKVVGTDGEDIAEVGDMVLTEDGKVDAMLIDFGGFLGMGQKRVAVGMDNLKFATDEGGQYFVYVDFTKEQPRTAT